MSNWAGHQRTLNHQTASNWGHYAAHRQSLSQLLCVGTPGMRLCVLGAGNCNDLDFEALSAWYSEITLVDLDLEAVTRAIERQPMAVRSLLRLRAPVDFGGFDEAVARGPTDPAAPQALAEAVARDVGVRDFDVVCSACVLSQLIDQVAQRFGSEPERCFSQALLTRALHINLMLILLRTGGRGVLVSDMVSSDSAPSLLSAPAQGLPKLMAQLVADKNFFTGLNPFALLKSDPQLAPLIARVVWHAPWLWQLAARRVYLTIACSFQRA